MNPAIAAELAELDRREAQQPRLNLSPEAVAALQAEKLALLAPLREDTARARLSARQAVEARPRGGEEENLAPYTDPVLAPERHAARIPPPLVDAPIVTPRITADPTLLAALADEARMAQDAFDEAEYTFADLRLRRDKTRSALLAYLRDSGIPVA